MIRISVVINTLNEEENLPHALNSIKDLADEVIVVDMMSDDETQEVAKEMGAKVYEHERMGYVEPARNFAISKATGDWILILDADERISPELESTLKQIVSKDGDHPQSVLSTSSRQTLRKEAGNTLPLSKGELEGVSLPADYYRLPRKNIVFNKWLRHSRWWPDHNIRFFRNGCVEWNELIHSVPITRGKGVDLEAKEENAIVHYHYSSIDQYIERMNRYTTHQAKGLVKNKYKFNWKDIISKPVNEFLSRYFAGEGYKDGLHGLALSGLQGFSEFVVYLKVWQMDNFKNQHLNIEEVVDSSREAGSDIRYWQADTLLKERGGLKYRIRRKLRI